MRRAIISVSDKTGIIPFAKALTALGFEIISTGGTFKMLSEAGVAPLVEVSDFTGFPEGLDGRIKTLTPKVFGGILALRENPHHRAFCKENGLEDIDIVCVNLYPFHQAYENEHLAPEDIIEQIDIGGPSMIRAAAKNYRYCLPVVDPADYEKVIEYLQSGEIPEEVRRRFAAKVFEMTAHYDLTIARFWSEYAERYPLRYGENPHQKAQVVRDPFYKGPNLLEAEILNGKPLSYNNLMDAGAALELALHFPETQAFAAIIKHATPCGAAVGETISEAFRKAYESDPLSAFGGIIVLNQVCDAETAKQIISFFNEIVLAPDYTSEALALLRTKPNLRVLALPDFTEGLTPEVLYRRVRGGTLAQEADIAIPFLKTVKTVTTKTVDEETFEELLIAWKCVKIIKSNAIALVKDGTLIGKGGGQTSRVEALAIALQHAKEKAQNAVLASDAFFPFPDSIELAAKHGIKAIIQPGGSKNDEAVIEACNKAGIAMVFTGTRAFLH